ncbi:hypothetical protein AALF85_05345 [Jeotgalicoccus halotolerans]|uniref:hypothetical protein n=1 Tax=Jeotgalicoccus halotolerans TaxID=157227 RepID=UPI003516DB76
MSEQETKMNKDYKSIFLDEFGDKKDELEKQRDEYDKVKNIYIDDMKKIIEALQPVINLISSTHDNSAELLPMKDCEELYVKYKGDYLLSYKFSYNNIDEEDYRYIIKVESEDEVLPNLFIKFYDEENYYYQEDELYGDSAGYISYPYHAPGNLVKDNNLEKVIEKHVKYIANYIAEEKYGLVSTDTKKAKSSKGRFSSGMVW